ncbi:isochorismate synthase [Flavobacterium antarcticum]|uniref:isochorismate synthase n=1 Tax=Flavobacterium antarcticum TaxID=271155 RepID=UPI0003B4D835|nr:isochorismate synthase [Flavobacterium antarcticum]
MLNIFQKAAGHFKENLPFVLYAKPNSTQVIGIFQQNINLYESTDLSEKGFVFADFKGSQAIIFPYNESEILNQKYEVSDNLFHTEELKISEDGKEAFENLVQKGIKAIEEQVLEKVVLSRQETLKQKNFSFLEVYQNMLSTYPNAFRYCWFHPEVGMWFGATPEQLLKVENSKFETVALAGTQKYDANSEAVWQQKEKQEQQFVTDFILGKLAAEAQSLRQTQPFTFQAGNVVHLKTTINGIFKSDFDLKKVLKVLHPTPAVCGLPKEVAKDFILKNEGYERKFYAGFLGELNGNLLKNENKDSNLFVNLRCMEIQQSKIHLYIGCGITKESNPEKEYFETANKAMTMKRILD